MQIEMRIVKDTNDNVKRPESERKSVSVETHSRRGDSFNVDKTDNVMEGDTVLFAVPNGGRLILTTPQEVNEVVYDRDQAAAVKTANQTGGNVADKPPVTPSTAPAVTPVAPPRPTMTAAQPAPQPSRLHQPNPVEAAKAAQQTTPRPAGEKAPLPGSPVGSPPAGNEGKDNK